MSVEQYFKKEIVIEQWEKHGYGDGKSDMIEAASSFKFLCSVFSGIGGQQNEVVDFNEC